MKQPLIHYCYRHIRPDTNVPFYIGIGVKNRKNPISFESDYHRAFACVGKRRPLHWKRIFDKNDGKIVVEIIYESSSREEIKNKEKEFIQLYGRVDLGTGTLINKTDGGDGANGYKHSEDSRKKIALALTGIIRSPEEILKNSLARKGVPTGRANPHIAAFNRALKGVPKSEEVKIKISKTLTGRYIGGDNKGAVPIVQLSREGDFIKEWPAIKSAARELKLNNITAVLIGAQKHCGGFKWAYAKDYHVISK